MPNDRMMQEWHSLVQAAQIADAHPVQLQEMRRAFFAGAAAALNVLLELGSDRVNEDDGAAVIEEVRQEIKDFGRRVAAGQC